MGDSEILELKPDSKLHQWLTWKSLKGMNRLDPLVSDLSRDVVFDRLPFFSLFSDTFLTDIENLC